MQEETEVLGENLRGQVWIENQSHIACIGLHRWKAREQPLRQPARPIIYASSIKLSKELKNGIENLAGQAISFNVMDQNSQNVEVWINNSRTAWPT